MCVFFDFFYLFFISSSLLVDNNLVIHSKYLVGTDCKIVYSIFICFFGPADLAHFFN